MTKETRTSCTSALIMLLAIFVISPFLVMVCWNYIMTLLFGLPTITLFKAFVLKFLAGLLFKSTSYQEIKDQIAKNKQYP
jgi:small-conductance mechanosensitive channel